MVSFHVSHSPAYRLDYLSLPIKIIQPPKVLNARNLRGRYYTASEVYVGRPSKWGNPFKAGREGTREEVIRLYELYILTHSTLLKDLHELTGKDLICWCSPLACHADVLLELANKDLV